MDAAQTRSDPPVPPRCPLCGQVIGVYEPAVALIDGTARRTSRAADPEFFRTATGVRPFHLACYEGDGGV